MTVIIRSRTRVRRLTWADGPGALSNPDTGKIPLTDTAQRTEPKPPTTNVEFFKAWNVDFATELFRVRTTPELYDDRYVDHINDIRDTMTVRLPDGYMDWDCTGCKRAVITGPDLPHTCPNKRAVTQ